MTFNFFSQLGRLIAGVSTPAVSAPSGVDQRPVLQLNALPMTLLPATYANAHSSINPEGSYTALYAFSELADAVPSFSEYYSASLNTVSAVYNNLLHGASVMPDALYTGSVIAAALKNFTSAELASMDGIPGNWYPVYATPVDWYNTSDPSRFSEITLDLTGQDKDDNGPYRIVDGTAEAMAAHSIITSNGAATQIDPASTLKSVTFHYLEVQLTRPWLDFEVFNLSGWFIGGQQAGYYSDGSIDDNQGVMPLITTSMLVAINVEVEADWSARDQQLIDTAKPGEGIAVGPFAINAASATELHVIGWVSRLVPLVPQSSHQ